VGERSYQLDVSQCNTSSPYQPRALDWIGDSPFLWGPAVETGAANAKIAAGFGDMVDLFGVSL
jgi:hypothetical protein